MKHFPIAIFFVSILCLPSLYAQHQVGKNIVYEIKGKVVDASNALPIEHATVSLISAGKVLQTVTTDLSGGFKFVIPQTESPSILVTYVGYESQLSKSITSSKVLEVRLVSQFQSLEEIVVKGKRKPIRYKSDKLIYDAGSDISNKAGSAVDLLRKVPLLTVGSNGELRMRGNTNIKVLL
ncbi:MAG: carboxypeptidase-like regulatory domain-containing protein, partial [Sphingobacterium sp.]